MPCFRGDTVNRASRTETHGEPGRVQLSDEIRVRLGADVVVEARGIVEVKGKGKGPFRTWWLVVRR